METLSKSTNTFLKKLPLILEGKIQPLQKQKCQKYQLPCVWVLLDQCIIITHVLIDVSGDYSDR